MKRLCMLGGGLLIALAALGAPSAFAADKEPMCANENLGPGIYPDYPDRKPTAADKGKFYLAFSSSKAGDKTHPSADAVSVIEGGAFLCGTDPGSNHFYQRGVITIPTASDAIVRCANKNFTGKYCAQQRNAGYNDIADGTYVGTLTSDAYCKGNILECPTDVNNNVKTEQYVDLNTSDQDTFPPPGYGDKAGDRCLEGGTDEFGNTIYAVACYEARGSFFTVNCNADVVYSVKDNNDTTPPKMNIYDMHCEDGNNAPQYMLSIEDLVICAWAGKGSGKGGCSTKPDPATGNNLNGKAGTWTYPLTAYLTDGTTESATSDPPVIWS